jgi:ATP-binding protein involved in chromosome partitioning
VPIDPAIRDGGDSGNPIVTANPASPQSAAFREIAQKIIAEVTGATKGVPPIESLLSKIKKSFTPT